MLRILQYIVIVVMIATAPVDAWAINWGKFIEAITKKAGKTTSKQADELPTTGGNKSGSIDDELETNGPLITRSLAKALHNKSCPAMRLRVSLPQLNVSLTVPDSLNVRSGPGTNYLVKNKFPSAGIYNLDLLSSQECWIKIRYAIGGGEYETGWTSAKHLKFEFDNHLTMPKKRLTRELDGEDVYELVAGSTYKIQTTSTQGSAVAISPTVLLTNCHVMGQNESVKILEGNLSFHAILIHDESYHRIWCLSN